MAIDVKTRKRVVSFLTANKGRSRKARDLFLRCNGVSRTSAFRLFLSAATKSGKSFSKKKAVWKVQEGRFSSHHLAVGRVDDETALLLGRFDHSLVFMYVFSDLHENFRDGHSA